MQVVAAINTIELNSLDNHEFDIDFKRPNMRNLDIFDFLQYTFGFQVFAIILLTLKSSTYERCHYRNSVCLPILLPVKISQEIQWSLFFQFETLQLQSLLVYCDSVVDSNFGMCSVMFVLCIHCRLIS